MFDVPITVYTPVYNGARYISETIDSVLNQSYSNFEYIIVNDGSLDKTEDIICKYARTDKRVRLISQENKGVSFASNVALSQARGKYYIRIDADDLCHIDRFRVIYEYMEANPGVTVCSSLMRLFGETKPGVTTQAEKDSEIRVFFLSNPAISNSASCIRASFLKKHSLFFDTTITFGEDFDLWSRMSFIEECVFYNIQRPLISCRIHATSATQTINDEKKYNFLKNIRLRHIKSLNIFPSEREIGIHCMLMDRKKNLNIDELKLAELWVNKLISINKELFFYDHSILCSLLTKRLLHSVAVSSVKRNELASFLFDSDVFRSNSSILKLIIVLLKKYFR